MRAALHLLCGALFQAIAAAARACTMAAAHHTRSDSDRELDKENGAEKHARAAKKGPWRGCRQVPSKREALRPLPCRAPACTRANVGDAKPSPADATGGKQMAIFLLSQSHGTIPYPSRLCKRLGGPEPPP